MTSLTVSLPAYNEAENVEAMIDMVRAKVGSLVDDLEIVVVDDGSSDNTAAIVQEMGQQDPRVRLLRHSVNEGYGAAVHDAVWAATKALVFSTDSDLQFDLAELARFLPRIGEADMVIGYRRARGDPWHRSLFGHGWSWLVNILFGYAARDVDCAFKLFKREIIDAIEVESRGATYSAEFLVRAKGAGFKIVEEPVSHYPRLAGSPTGARPDVIIRAFRELLKLRWKMWMERLQRHQGKLRA